LGYPHGTSVKFGLWTFHKLWKWQKMFDFWLLVAVPISMVSRFQTINELPFQIKTHFLFALGLHERDSHSTSRFTTCAHLCCQVRLQCLKLKLLEKRFHKLLTQDRGILRQASSFPLSQTICFDNGLFKFSLIGSSTINLIKWRVFFISPHPKGNFIICVSLA